MMDSLGEQHSSLPGPEGNATPAKPVSGFLTDVYNIRREMSMLVTSCLCQRDCGVVCGQVYFLRTSA